MSGLCARRVRTAHLFNLLFVSIYTGSKYVNFVMFLISHFEIRTHLKLYYRGQILNYNIKENKVLLTFTNNNLVL